MIGETVKCSFCDFESSATAVAYHELNRHPELLEWEPYDGLPAPALPCSEEPAAGIEIESTNQGESHA